MKKLLVGILLLSGMSLLSTPVNKVQDQHVLQNQAGKVTSGVTLEETEHESTFFSQLRWFIIAGISLKTLSLALEQMQDKKGGGFVHVTDPKMIDGLYIILGGAFGIWMTDKMKYMDPVANYWVRQINTEYEEMNKPLA